MPVSGREAGRTRPHSCMNRSNARGEMIIDSSKASRYERSRTDLVFRCEYRPCAHLPVPR